MQEDYLEIKYNDINFSFYKNDFVTILGNNNYEISNCFDVDVISFKTISEYKNNSVLDEIKKHTKSNVKIKEQLEKFNLTEYKNNNINNLSINEKIKLSILLKLIDDPKLIVINNILSLLDNNDYKNIIKILKEYNKGNLVINLTNKVDESLFGNRVIIVYENKLICDGDTLEILNEEKVLKRLGIGLPFIIELNKYLMDYGLIDDYYLSNKKLVGELWK